MKQIFGNTIQLTDYHSAKQFCLEYRTPFNGFTELQECILQNPDYWNNEKNLIIKGMPGSGKTLLAEIAFLSMPKQEGGSPRKLLYLLPYRALLNQKYEYFIRGYNRSYFRIYRSSSDYYDYDENIIAADCEIAIMIYEKLDNALRSCPDAVKLFYEYDLIIMDEFSLIGSIERGIIINDILHRYHSIPTQSDEKMKARVIALTVPECLTSEYNQWGFLTLKNNARSVYLHEAIIQADDGTVHPKNRETKWPITYEDLINIDAKAPDKRNTYWPEIDEIEIDPYSNQELLLNIIKAHRMLNHHIIVFCSNRENARNISYRVSQMVKENHMHHGDWSERLTSIQSSIGDNCYGSIDYRMIRSAYYGVTYHNADLPSQLRKEIEKEFSKTHESRLDIIVSTETLAYGINCSADVVIIYERIKPASEDDYPVFKYGNTYMRYLNSIEYQNFVGRAGRLGYGEGNPGHCGYAYLFSKDALGAKKIRSIYYAATGRRFRSCRRLFAIKLWLRPLTTTAIVFDQIPIDERYEFDREDLVGAVKFLAGKKKLIREETVARQLIDEMKKLQLIEDEQTEDKYTLTRLGSAIHGSHIPYEILCGLGPISKSMKRNGFSLYFLLFRLCGIIHNSDLCGIDRKVEHLHQACDNIDRLFNELAARNEIEENNLKTLQKFAKSIRNSVNSLTPNAYGTAYISEELFNKLHQYQNSAILYLWANGYSIEDINREYMLPARYGAIKNLSKNIIHVIDCLIKYLGSYMDNQHLVQQISEAKLMIKYGMPFYCIEALNYQVESSIRPEICELIAKLNPKDCISVLEKIASHIKINDGSSLNEIKKVRVELKQMGGL